MLPSSPNPSRAVLCSTVSTMSLAVALGLTVVAGRLGNTTPSFVLVPSFVVGGEGAEAWRSSGIAKTHDIPPSYASKSQNSRLNATSTSLSGASPDPTTFALVTLALLASSTQLLLHAFPRSPNRPRPHIARWASHVGLVGGALCSAILALLAYPTLVRLLIRGSEKGSMEIPESPELVAWPGFGVGLAPGLVFCAGVLLVWGGVGEETKRGFGDAYEDEKRREIVLGGEGKSKVEEMMEAV